MTAHKIGPWRVKPYEVTILLWILSTYEREGIDWTQNLTGKVSSALSILRKTYAPFGEKEMILLFKKVASIGFSVPCTTLWEEVLEEPASCRQYYTFLLRMRAGKPDSGIGGFLDRVEHPREISENIQKMLHPFLPHLPFHPEEIEWGRTRFGPGSFSNPHHGDPPCFSTWDRLLLMFSHPFPYSRLCSVPKDYKIDRLIASEPLEHQILCYPLARYLMEEIERASKGSINFSHQEYSRAACRTWNATIDSSNASDNVQLSHVADTMAEYRGILFALRTKAFVVGNSTKPIRLTHMFATMGSFLTFPVETWVFYAYTYAILKMCGANRDQLRSIRVYGDDIVVPAEFAEYVIYFFELLGFEINVNKSYWRAEEPFRETCGAETWNNVDITPVRMPRGFPVKWLTTITVPQIIDLISHFSEKGLYITADILYQYVFACHFTSKEQAYRGFLGLRKSKQKNYLYAILMKVGLNDDDCSLSVDSPYSGFRCGEEIELPSTYDSSKRRKPKRFREAENENEITWWRQFKPPIDITAELVGGDIKNYRKFIKYFIALTSSARHDYTTFVYADGRIVPDYICKDMVSYYDGIFRKYRKYDYRVACWMGDPKNKYQYIIKE